MTTQTAAAVKPLPKLSGAYIRHFVPGSPYVVGDRVTIHSLSNVGTRRAPQYRYYVGGGFYDHDALSPTPVEM